jgi:hypothetical protein
LQAYGYTLAAFYAGAYFLAYRHGVWLLDGKGTPLFSDFAAGIWLTGLQPPMAMRLCCTTRRALSSCKKSSSGPVSPITQSASASLVLEFCDQTTIRRTENSWRM